VLAHLGLSLVVYREAVLGQRQPPRTHAIDVRFTGVQPALPLANLKSSIVNKLVSITGYVVRVSSIQPLVTRAAFECPKCGAMVQAWFEDGKFAIPTRCDNSSCRAKVFELRRDTAATEDYQKVKIQETDNSLAEAGRVPRTVEVELMKGLVDSCIPGDLVTVVGVVNSIKSEAGKAGKGKATSLYLLYVVANSVVNNRTSQGPVSSDGRLGEVRTALPPPPNRPPHTPFCATPYPLCLHSPAAPLERSTSGAVFA
jgi:DNA helicase MCM8